MRFPQPAAIASMWPPTVLLLWLVKALLLPGVEVLGAPTQTSVPARHSRGDRTVPPGSMDDVIDGLVAERSRRAAIELTAASAEPAKEAPPADDAGRTQLSRLSRQSGHGTQGPGNAPPEPRMDARKVHKTDSNEDYYYYYYYDSFVEGVTTRDDLEEYSENGAPMDLEDSEDDSDDGEIMELLNLAPSQKVG